MLDPPCQARGVKIQPQHGAPVPIQSLQRHYSGKHTYSIDAAAVRRDPSNRPRLCDELPYRIARLCTAPIIAFDL